MTDAQLLEQYLQHQSHQAFAELVAQHTGWIYAMACRQVGDEHLAHDITQAVFLLLARKAPTIRNRPRLGAWLLKTTQFTINHALRDQKRRRMREREVAATRSDADSSADPARAQPSACESLCIIDHALSQLRSFDRQLLLSRFYAGKTMDAIARESNLTAEAVRKRTARSLARLRRRLADHPQLDLPAVLAPLTAISHVPVPFSAEEISHTATNPSKLAARPAALCKGAAHMMISHQLKVASIGLAAMLVLGTAVVALCENGGDSAQPPPAAAPQATALPAAPAAIMSKDVIVVVSADGKKLAACASQTGRWATVDADGFDFEHIITSDGVGIWYNQHAVYAFSPVKETWSRLDVDAAGQELVPVLSAGLVALSTPGKLHAFSAQTGNWDSISVAHASQLKPSVDSEKVWAQEDDHFYLFGAKSGKWSSPF